MNCLHTLSCILAALVAVTASATEARGQAAAIRYGEHVPPDVKLIYERGLNYLATTQQQDGSWAGGQAGSGITGLCLMAFLANGEDPNYGQYSSHIQNAVRSIIQSQDPRTGYIPQRMYDHGFAMLALAEAYGAVDEELLWAGEPVGQQRSIGSALELAVRCALTAQRKNSFGGWRYSPDSRDADTSVSGAVLMGLLAARNAGIEVPDEAIDKALQYYKNSTSNTGMVAYSGGVGGHGQSMNRSAIATLVYSVGKRKDWPEFKATLHHITSQLEHQESAYPFYFRYYMAQALFQGDFDAWNKWKQENMLALRDLQQDNGSFNSNHGEAYGTAMALLSLALDFRFLPIYER
jgi:hypothetical protein